MKVLILGDDHIIVLLSVFPYLSITYLLEPEQGDLEETGKSREGNMHRERFSSSSSFMPP